MSQKLLTVEEDDIDRALTTYAYEHGFELLTTSNNATAVELGVAKRPGTILLDVAFPPIQKLEWLLQKKRGGGT